MSETRELPPGVAYRHPAEADLDTAEEQAQVLLRDLRESFAPSYLTLISIIEGVLLGLSFELLATGNIAVRLNDPAILVVVNNLILIMLVWNEYRMGSSMFRWVPSLADAVIPFMVGGFQAALVLTVPYPLAWLGWMAAFYATGVIAYQNMYRRSAEEERNAFVLAHNGGFQRLNLASCLLVSALLGMLFSYHAVHDSTPGWYSLGLVTLLNVAFMVRGEANWRAIVAATRAVAFPQGRQHSALAATAPHLSLNHRISTRPGAQELIPVRGSPAPGRSTEEDAYVHRAEQGFAAVQMGLETLAPHPLSRRCAPSPPPLTGGRDGERGDSARQRQLQTHLNTAIIRRYDEDAADTGAVLESRLHCGPHTSPAGRERGVAHGA
jgi:hypothetical protein